MLFSDYDICFFIDRKMNFEFIFSDHKPVKYSEYILSEQGFERKKNETINGTQKP
jgi:hypothetical protein